MLPLFAGILGTEVDPARHGLPLKLYADQGKPFVNHHARIICANLGIRLLHAKLGERARFKRSANLLLLEKHLAASVKNSRPQPEKTPPIPTDYLAEIPRDYRGSYTNTFRSCPRFTRTETP